MRSRIVTYANSELFGVECGDLCSDVVPLANGLAGIMRMSRNGSF